MELTVRPAFLITIDTEGDLIWQRPTKIETHNARYLPRFQQLCERFGFKPTWLTNYEMAMSDEYREFGRDVLARGTGEIGMHLHAWNSPPETPLTTNDYHHQPFLIDYPPEQVTRKVEFMTRLLEDRFDVRMLSHRAGRWAMNAHYARLLIEHGYRVDCSVTPTWSWRKTPGAPGGNGGSDYSRCPSDAYFLDPDDFTRPGSSPLLELPMTIDAVHPALIGLQDSPLARLPVLRRFILGRRWLRPVQGNLPKLLRLVEGRAARGEPYLEFMLHSSELMPGGSLIFPDGSSIERLYDDLTQLFETIARYAQGCTLAEYADGVEAGHYPARRAGDRSH